MCITLLQDGQALLHCQRILNENPDHGAAVLQLLGWCYIDQGDWEMATQVFERAVNVNNDVLNCRTLAALYKVLGECDRGLEILEQTHELVQVQLLRGALFYASGNIVDALKEYTKVQEKYSSISIHYRLGVCCHALGRYADAMCWYDLVLEEDLSHQAQQLKQLVSLYCCKSDSILVHGLINANDSLDLSPNSCNVSDYDISMADKLGKLAQVNSLGFACNKRHHRMFGFAVLAMMQYIQGDSTNYRSFMSICANWRQLSEPSEPVLWIDSVDPDADFNGEYVLETPFVGEMSLVHVRIISKW